MQLAEKLNMSGFRLHVGGTFDYEHLITYVGGTMIDNWDIEPESLTLDTLNRTIDIEEGRIEIFVEHSISDVDNFLGDYVGNNGESTRNDPKSAEDDVPNPDEESDEEWLEYVENTVGQLEPDSDSGSEYSVGMDYEDNDDLNWSLSDEEDLDVDVEELRHDVGQVPGHRWRNSRKCYYDPERPALRLHMIFKFPAQFREALVENSIESGHPFKYWKNFGAESSCFSSVACSRASVRHIYANWKVKHPGKDKQLLLWRTAKSTTEETYRNLLEAFDDVFSFTRKATEEKNTRIS
ncbi:hypothetical protein ACFE04_020681 [Oxalis oulophora]